MLQYERDVIELGSLCLCLPVWMGVGDVRCNVVHFCMFR